MAELDRLVKATQSTSGVIPFVGSGLSIEATGNARHASWSGLILDGMELCQRTLPNLHAGWADGLREHLRQGDVTSYLTAAQEVSTRLQEWADGRVFANWLSDGVGALTATDEALPTAVAHLGRLIVTTNYDTLVERASNHETVSWSDEGATDAAFKDEAKSVVFHLHGVAGKPNSVILGWSDYQRLSERRLSGSRF